MFDKDQTEINENEKITEEKDMKKDKTKRRFIAMALCFSLIGGVCGAGVMKLSDVIGNDASTINLGTRPSSIINVNHVNTGEELTAAEIYAKYVNSTVGIKTESTTNYFGHTTTSATAGSGFILTSDGYIVTNYHVIQNAQRIQVTTYDNTSYDAILVGYDENNDIAVLKIEAENLTPVVLGDSGNMNVGDDVVAIGNPLGELTFSLTGGKVSALNRDITTSEGITMELIQTDCAINSGNSGGALFNMYGEVIGITNAKYSSSSSGTSIDNIGFAIPISNVLDIIESIIEKGYVSMPYIGVTVTDASDQSSIEGALVAGIQSNSPAEQANLQEGDIITSVNGETISGSSDLKDKISESKVGDTLSLEVYRNGKTLTIQVTVGEQNTTNNGANVEKSNFSSSNDRN